MRRAGPRLTGFVVYSITAPLLSFLWRFYPPEAMGDPGRLASVYHITSDPSLFLD